jgi:hypothetical protein
MWAGTLPIEGAQLLLVLKRRGRADTLLLHITRRKKERGGNAGMT